MAWSLEWGSQVEFLTEIAEMSGITPSGLLNKPEIGPDLFGYVNLYWTLHAGRNYGMAGALPLQVSEIEAYYRLVGEADSEERLKGLIYMQRMDQVYLNHAAKEADSRK